MGKFILPYRPLSVYCHSLLECDVTGCCVIFLSRAMRAVQYKILSPDHPSEKSYHARYNNKRAFLPPMGWVFFCLGSLGDFFHACPLRTVFIQGVHFVGAGL